MYNYIIFQPFHADHYKHLLHMYFSQQNNCIDFSKIFNTYVLHNNVNKYFNIFFEYFTSFLGYFLDCLHR